LFSLRLKLTGHPKKDNGTSMETTAFENNIFILDKNKQNLPKQDKGCHPPKPSNGDNIKA
jgi:hypothetical protein